MPWGRYEVTLRVQVEAESAEQAKQLALDHAREEFISAESPAVVVLAWVP